MDSIDYGSILPSLDLGFAAFDVDELLAEESVYASQVEHGCLIYRVVQMRAQTLNQAHSKLQIMMIVANKIPTLVIFACRQDNVVHVHIGHDDGNISLQQLIVLLVNNIGLTHLRLENVHNSPGLTEAREM